MAILLLLNLVRMDDGCFSAARPGTFKGLRQFVQSSSGRRYRTLLFQSYADDLVPADYNGSGDLFILHLGGIDSDEDGMDDDWEMAHFETLERDGTGDFDSDGQPDRAEFRSGTDPTDLGSVLTVLRLQRVWFCFGT